MNRTWRALGSLAIVALLIRFVIGCAAHQPTTQPADVIILLDDGTHIVQISPHPCEGNWNFCDHTLDNLGNDDLDSFYIPAF